MENDHKDKRLLSAAALSLAVAVTLGALGAHALKDSLTPDQLDSWKTGVLYQVIHSMGMLVTGLLPIQKPGKWWIQRLFMTGIICFSGSIYLLSTLGWRWLGPITPLGGLCFIGAWVYLAFLLFRRN